MKSSRSQNNNPTAVLDQPIGAPAQPSPLPLWISLPINVSGYTAALDTPLAAVSDGDNVFIYCLAAEVGCRYPQVSWSCQQFTSAPKGGCSFMFNRHG